MPSSTAPDAARRSAAAEPWRTDAASAHRLSERVRNPGRSGPPLKSLGVRESPAGVGCLSAGGRPGEATVRNLEVCLPHRDPQMPRGRRHGDVRAICNVWQAPGVVNEQNGLFVVFRGPVWAAGGRVTIRPLGRQGPFAAKKIPAAMDLQLPVPRPGAGVQGLPVAQGFPGGR